MLLGKCNIMLSDTPSSDTYLHFLRENGDKAHISRFTLISQSGGSLLFHSSEKFSFITKLLSRDVVRRPQKGGNSVPVMLNIKKKTNPRPPYSEAELWHFTQ